MTVLFAGGEDSSFTLVGASITPRTTANTFRSTFSRCCLGAVGLAPSTADPPVDRITSPAFTPSGTIWVHWVMGTTNSSNANTNNATMMRALDTGVARIVVRGTGTAGQLKIDTRNAAGTFVNLVTSAAGAYPANVGTVTFDLFINYSATGQCILYANGVSIADTGAGVNVTTNGATTLNQIELCNVGPGTGGQTMGWSEIIVQTTSSLGTALWTLPPAAAGNTQSWTPNTLANINKTTIADGTSISTASANALSQWTTPVSPPAGIWAVEAIVQNARISRGASGPQNFEFLCRTIDGTDHVGGTTNPTTSFANYNFIWSQNPFTATDWAIADISTGFNLGVESLA